MIKLYCENVFVWFIEYQYLLCHGGLRECTFNLKSAESPETHSSKQEWYLDE